MNFYDKIFELGVKVKYLKNNFKEFVSDHKELEKMAETLPACDFLLTPYDDLKSYCREKGFDELPKNGLSKSGELLLRMKDGTIIELKFLGKINKRKKKI